MKKDVYEVIKNVERIQQGLPTGFVTGNVSVQIKNHFKKNACQEFLTYPDAEKIILYPTDYVEFPKVRLYRIDCFEELKHSSIMGSLFGLNITASVFGDIVYYDGYFYVYVLDSIHELIENEFTSVGNVSIKLVEVDIDYLSNYRREYEEIKLIVSSLRIDTVCSRLIGTSRDNISTLIKNGEIFVNYSLVKKNEQILIINDVFSIRGFGKYRMYEIIGKTKKDNYIILVQKYL